MEGEMLGRVEEDGGREGRGDTQLEAGTQTGRGAPVMSH
jgi:hypothetical protein